MPTKRPSSDGATRSTATSTSPPGATAPWYESGTVSSEVMRSPPTKTILVPGGHGTSPTFLIRQILVKDVPGAICVPSKMETSRTKRAASFGPPPSPRCIPRPPPKPPPQRPPQPPPCVPHAAGPPKPPPPPPPPPPPAASGGAHGGGISSYF